MNCPHCDSNVRPEAKFCPRCGQFLRARCTGCGTDLQAGDQFCSECGALVRGVEPAAQTADSAHGQNIPVEAERKRLTVMFVDIQGSMDLLRNNDVDTGRGVIDAALQTMSEIVQRNRGSVVKTTGDGILATFGAPQASEDHAICALIAGLELRESFLRDSTKPDAPVIRVGVHSGDAVVRALSVRGLENVSDPVGFNVGVAARVQTAAPPGGVVVTADTFRLTKDYFEFRPLGAKNLKGVEAGLEVYELVRRGSVTRRFQLALHRGLTPYVGRSDEVSQLRQGAERAARGQGRVAVVIGEPGVGKSRLLHELRSVLPRNCVLAEGFCSAGEESDAWRPIAQWMTGLLFPHRKEGTPVTGPELHARLITLDPVLADALPYLECVISNEKAPDSDLTFLDPQLRRVRIFDSLRRVVLRASAESPVALFLDDVQWAQPQVSDFLKVLGEAISTSPVFMLLAARPEFRPAWLPDVGSMLLRLGPLDTEEVSRLVAMFATEQPRAFAELVREKSGGNPFFIEELMRAFIEDGTIAEERRLKLRRSLEEIGIPETVQALLASRIDQLGAKEKRMLQVASVLGRKFGFELAERISELSKSDVARSLEALQTQGFLVEGVAAGERVFEFRHALMQETAYSSLVSNTRHDAHQRCATAIEDLYRFDLPKHLADLARHYRAAGQCPRAVQYYQRAATEATSRFADAEATQLMREALATAGELPMDDERRGLEFQLLTGLLGPTVIAFGAASLEARDIAERAYALCDTVKDSRVTFDLVRNYWNIRLTCGDYQHTHHLEAELLERAEQTRDSGCILEAHRAKAEGLFWRGDFEASASEAEQTIRLYDPQKHHQHVFLYGEDPGIAARGYASCSLALRGFELRAETRVQEAIALAPALRHPLAKAMALVLAMLMHRIRNDPRAAAALGPTVREFCTQQGIASWGAWGAVLYGWALAHGERDGSGLAELSQVVRALEDSGTGVALASIQTMEAEAYLSVNRVEDASRLLTRAMGSCELYGERWTRGDILRLQAACFARSNPPAEALVEKYLEAGRASSSVGARLLALRSFTSALQVVPSDERLRGLVSETLAALPEPGDVPDVRAARAALQL